MQTAVNVPSRGRLQKFSSIGSKTHYAFSPRHKHETTAATILQNFHMGFVATSQVTLVYTFTLRGREGVGGGSDRWTFWPATPLVPSPFSCTPNGIQIQSAVLPQ